MNPCIYIQNTFDKVEKKLHSGETVSTNEVRKTG